MNNLTNWLQSITRSAESRLRTFMAGRYGIDKLSMVILCGGLGVSMLSYFLQGYAVRMLACALSYGLMIWAIFRGLSRNISKRYQENRSFLRLLDRVRDRKNRYFTCPRCRQTVRVPRHKGKIAITCPKCKERFERRT